jgi:hypothetical protein
MKRAAACNLGEMLRKVFLDVRADVFKGGNGLVSAFTRGYRTLHLHSACLAQP